VVINTKDRATEGSILLIGPERALFKKLKGDFQAIKDDLEE
jgi:hypothetical protein